MGGSTVLPDMIQKYGLTVPEMQRAVGTGTDKFLGTNGQEKEQDSWRELVLNEAKRTADARNR